MSIERHPDKYRPEYRSKRGNKIRRRKGPQSGSRFHKQLARSAKLRRRELERESLTATQE